MSLRTLMQAGPVKANELFAKLSDTSGGAVKTREKLFTELKAELELHTSLEEQHLFPVLRRNAETKELVIDAVKDNKDLRGKLAELDALPKNDETFTERLKELQKAFRQHARDEKRELLPAVQRALSEEQVQSVTEKMEAGVVEAEKARHDEAEARRAKARQEREQSEQQVAQEAAERARQATAAQARQVEQEAAERARQATAAQARQIEQEATARRAQDETEDRRHDMAQTAARTAAAAQTTAAPIVGGAETGAHRVGAKIRGALASSGAPTRTPAPRASSIWMDWMDQTTRAGTQMSQDLLRQVTERQRRLAATAMDGWMAHNVRVMRTTLHLAEAALQPFINRSTDGSTRHRNGR